MPSKILRFFISYQLINIFLSIIAGCKLKSYKSCGTSSLGEREAYGLNIKIFRQGCNIQRQILFYFCDFIVSDMSPMTEEFVYKIDLIIAYVVLVAASVIIFVLFGYNCLFLMEIIDTKHKYQYVCLVSIISIRSKQINKNLGCNSWLN